MPTFLDEILALPTGIFTVLLAVALVYWVVSILGIIDLDGTDGLDGAADALDGAADAVDGVAEALEGAADAIDGKAAAMDAASAALDARSEKGSGRAFRRKAPVTVRFSVFAITAWSVSYLVIHNAASDPTQVGAGLMAIASASAAVVGWLAARVAGQKLGGLMLEHTGETARDMVGREVEVTTGEVTMSFGQGRIDNGGAGLTVNIRCEAGRLSRGDRGMVVDYDAKDGVYTVEPLDAII